MAFYRVEGLDSLAFKLRTADEKIRQEAISGVRKATRLVYVQARADAPFDTGLSQSSVTMSVDRPRTVAGVSGAVGGFLRHRYEGSVGFDMNVTRRGLFHELGTGIHGPFRRPYAVFTGGGGFRHTPAGGSGLGYYLHPGVPAMHFVRNAGIKMDPAIQVIFRRTGRRIAKRIASGV